MLEKLKNTLNNVTDAVKGIFTKEFFGWFKSGGWKKYLPAFAVIGLVDYGFVSNLPAIIAAGGDGMHIAMTVIAYTVIAVVNFGVLVHMGMTFKKSV